ncbi:protein DsrB [Morganella morganii]|nr:protein DsrB [Morganella morganii]
MMQINDTVYVKTDANEPREGRILLIEPFSEGVMYLVALPEYPDGIWFFNEKEGGDGVFITPKNNF